jgi:hypothetical protein
MKIKWHEKKIKMNLMVTKKDDIEKKNMKGERKEKKRKIRPIRFKTLPKK